MSEAGKSLAQNGVILRRPSRIRKRGIVGNTDFRVKPSGLASHRQVSRYLNWIASHYAVSRAESPRYSAHLRSAKLNVSREPRTAVPANLPDPDFWTISRAATGRQPIAPLGTAAERFTSLYLARPPRGRSTRHPNGTAREEPVDETHLIDNEKAEGKTHQS